MKRINKKAVSVFTALTLAFSPVYSGLSVISYAAEQVSSNEAFLSVPSGTTASNGMFTITFDPSAVTVTEVTPGSMFEGIMTSTNIRDGKITFAFVNTKPMDIGGDIAKISYSSNGGTPAFTLKVNELVTIDSEGNEQTVSSEKFTVNTEKNIPASRTANLSVPKNTTATNGMFTVTFDPSVTTVTDVTPGEMFEGIMTSTNIKNGKITFAFVNTKPVDIGGKILKITYTSSEKNPAFTLKINELVTLDDEGKEQTVSGDNISTDVPDSETEDQNYGFTISSETEGASHSFKVKAMLPSGTGVTNGLLNLNFDASEISVSDIKACGDLANAMVETNISDGNAKIIFISTKPISGESWLEFEITGQKEATAKISLSADEFYHTDATGKYEAIPVSDAETSFSVLPEVTEPDENEVIIEKYDVCDDGCINAADLSMIQKILLAPDSASDAEKKRADINGDGTVDVLDMTALVKLILGME